MTVTIIILFKNYIQLHEKCKEQLLMTYRIFICCYKVYIYNSEPKILHLSDKILFINYSAPTTSMRVL